MSTVKKIRMGETIPKIIHQTYSHKEIKKLPQEIQMNIQAIKQINPNWEYRLYDDQDIEIFIKKHYGDTMLAIYKRINPEYGAARADLFRYLLIYVKGGVYLDIKSTTSRNLDSVIPSDTKIVLSNWRDSENEITRKWGLHKALKKIEGGEFQQWHIVAVAGHPIIKSVIENIILNIKKYHINKNGVGKTAVLRTTGPIAYSLAIEGVRHEYPHTFLNAYKELGLIYSIYGDCNKSSKHTEIFKVHYSNLTLPLIRPSFSDGLLASYSYSLHRIKNKIKSTIT